MKTYDDWLCDWRDELFSSLLDRAYGPASQRE